MKRNKVKRVLALVLASTMLLQQSSVGIFAAETEAVTEAQTEQATEAKAEETQAPATEAPAPETKAEETQAPATEAPAPETKAEETQAPAAEAPAEETKAEETQAPAEETKAEETQAPATEAPAEETQAPATEAPTEGSGTEETQAPSTEAPTETATEAPTEAATEALTEEETEAESETEEAVVLDTVITQEVFQKTVEDTVQPMVKYTVKVTNKAETADAEDVSVKVLLAEALSYSREDGETAELGVYEKLTDAQNADVFKDIELGEAVKDAYAEGSVALWQDQKIAAGEKKEFTFFAAVEDGETDTGALRSLWFVNDEEVTGNGKIEWLNTDLLKVEKELPTEFTYDGGNMVVTATLSDGAILPEGAQFVVTEKTLSEEEKALIEESLGDEQTMTGYVAYDMHFEVDGKEVEPENGTVSVSVSYEKAQALTPVDEGEKAVPEDGEVKMLHITDDQTVEDVTTDVNVKKNGKVREVGFTTEGFSTFVLMSSNELMPIADDTTIYVESMQIGTHTYKDVDIDSATGAYTGNFRGNTESNPLTAYLGNTVKFYANVPEGYTFEGDGVNTTGYENGKLVASFAGTDTSIHTIALTDEGGKEVDEFFVQFQNPIYVTTALGQRHMDEIHEYLGAIAGAKDTYVYAPDRNDGNPVPMYFRNTDEKQYVTYDEDIVTLTAVGTESDSFQIHNDQYYERITLVKNLESVTLESGLVKKSAKFCMHNTDAENWSPTANITFGTATFFASVKHKNFKNQWENGKANHFDIEIADGGHYTIKTTRNTQNGKDEIETTYDTYVDGVEQCLVFDAENQQIGKLMATEYYRHGGSPDSTQYELTSAYRVRDGKVVDSEGNPLPDGQFGGAKVEERDIDRFSVDHVEFTLRVYLKPKKQTINGKENTTFSVEDIIKVEGVKFLMEKQDVLDAFNKCPQHNGLDFTISAEFAEKIKFAALKLEAEKMLKGGDWEDEVFTFSLYAQDPSSGSPEALKSVTVKGTDAVEGRKKILFEELSFTDENIGEDMNHKKNHTYYIKEEEGDAKGIVYDTHVVKADVTVWSESDGTHVNVTYSYLNQKGEWEIDSTAPEFVNYKSTPEKTEVTPGDKKPVKVGDVIEYRVSYENYREAEATVTITDKLDIGLTYVPNSASDGGKYDEKNHTITWTLEKVAAGKKGTVSFKATVNDQAKLAWDYKNGENADEEDDLVLNQAGVQVGTDPKVDTNIVENPVGDPHKTEVTPGDRVMVGVGEKIRCEISWKNYQKNAATVVITDALDPGLDYVNGSATNGGVYDAKDHKITWTLKDQPAGKSDVVTFEATVNEKAYTTWAYDGDKDALKAGDGKDYEVWNRASVKVGDDPKQNTEIVENPVPEKTETDPGADKTVAVGKVITYKIHWKNGHEGPADVTITDKLDPGVDFESASGKGEDAGKHDAETHTVTWTLKNRAAGAEGDVELKVKVNKNAKLTWDYTNDAGEGEDGKILNQAGVKVGNDNEVKTQIIPNPVDKGPEKTEVMPGDCVMVGIGEEITYKITWKNYQDADADVVITDKLDPGVEFASASGEGDDVGKYDAATHTVTWTLEKRAANAEGFVTVTVKTTEKAFEGWKYVEQPGQGADAFEAVTGKDYEVWNRAAVKVGNDQKVYTNIVENPVPEKKEVTPGDRVMVNVGDPITYEIGWKNGYKKEAEVIVTDPLDPGVSYVSSEPAGTYDEKTHTVTWEIKAKSEEKGTIKLNVTVNENAFKDWKYGKEDVPVVNADKNVKDYEVWNRAKVQIDDDSQYTAIVENPVPEKTEVTPGDSKLVNVGDEITYEIYWKNGQEKEADVIITDPLDDGVDFVSASEPGSYAAEDHKVTWTLPKQAPNAQGFVTLTVKVNEKAFSGWKYEEKENKGASAAEDDYEVWNRAEVKVGNDSTFTNKVENPVTKKEETTPGDRKLVNVGDEITYKIYWKNGQEKEADVIITDPLDDGVDFVSASEPGSYAAEGHKVTWTLPKQPAGAQGYVTLTVKVNEKAFSGWKYDKEKNEGAATEGEDYEVWNRAEVKVGNDSTFTNEVENPVTKKEETTPGDRKLLNVGDEITYEIYWKNGQEKEADVIITDPLDDGVDFVSASEPGSYAAEGHKVTWTLPKQPAGAQGYVTLTVKVNEKAFSGWKYDKEKNEGAATEGEDYEVWNRAEVKVGNDSTFTNEVENPVTKKEETTPGDRKLVNVGDEITYEIYWKNGQKEAADVVITDPLDDGVDFSKADNNGSYDAAKHVVTWTLPKQPSGTQGFVTLTVKVNEKAFSGWKYDEKENQGASAAEDDYEVWNRAEVKIGNDATFTNKVENPVPEKTETKPGDRVMVNVGDPIVYEIGWKNGHKEAATVTVTDPLDPGVTYVSSEPAGKYDAAKHTVTWTFEAKGEEKGTIKLNVTVNENAFKDWKYGEADEPVIGKDEKAKDYEVWNRAKVQVGNDSAYTDIVENPVPEKTEVTPGDRLMVNVGDAITYEIGWKNGHKEAATVTVTDPLDPGVTYVSSEPAGKYDAAKHTVTWTFEAKGEEKGTIKLNVTVNENAFKDWKYGEADAPVVNADEKVKDYEVWNRAKVQVGNDSAYTDIVENPVPEKTEVTPGEGVMVEIGQDITYEIHWKNGHEEPATVTVTDKLDPGVTFKSADNGGICKDGVVTWTLNAAAAGEAGSEGSVKLTVTVNENAFDNWQYGSGDKPAAGEGKDYEVLNRATVKVGHDPAVMTEIIPNPVPEKTEVTPGKGVMVGVGQDITYEIHWKNGHEESATVTVTDKLDPGVTFKSADNGGTCKDGVVTWMLNAAAAGEAGSEGVVKLTVTVNENAYKTYTYGNGDTPVAGEGKDYEVLNRATVQVGHDPAVMTEIIPNPVPEKTETDPGANETVYVGDEITYEIHWKNGHDTAADVTVTDPLDEGLDFVSADLGGTYDAATRTVTWVIKNAAAGQDGKVTLVAKVNVNARKDDYIVENQAGVQVGNDPKVLTQIIPNPTPEEPRDGTIRVTKELTVLGEDLYAADETFYVALFSDEACTKRVTAIKALEFRDAAAATVTFEDIDIGRTYYVGEVDKDGTVILSGAVDDGTVFMANFNEGKSAAVENADGSTTVVFENTFQTIPNGYYRSGTLNITKKLLGVDGKALDSDATFYAGIFEDAAHTRLSDKVSENIVKLDLAGGSSVSESVSVACDPDSPTVLYVAEVTSDGTPVGKSFGYTVTIDNEKVSMDTDNLTADVTITNQAKEEETETESEAPKSTAKSVQTGDDTPIMGYVLLMLAALALAIAAETMRRRRRAGR